MVRLEAQQRSTIPSALDAADGELTMGFIFGDKGGGGGGQQIQAPPPPPPPPTLSTAASSATAVRAAAAAAAGANSTVGTSPQGDTSGAPTSGGAKTLSGVQ